jgi:hypothetical protein
MNVNKMKKVHIKMAVLAALILLPTTSIFAKTLYIATNGNDANAGTIAAPLSTLGKAQSMVSAGDTVFIRGGTYKITEGQIARKYSIWSYVFDMSKSGTAQRRICYYGYEDERPVFDLSDVKPADNRVIVFYVTGSYLHFKGFDIVGTQVTITEHTQSECFRNDGGSNNIYEHLAMHDGKAIGFYLTKGSNNLVLNCDAYNNWDNVSENQKGSNVDGFGGHPNAGGTGNVFRGCRAWYNSDDGFDLIRAYESVTIDSCWAFRNGYSSGMASLGDGTGFKAGGWGMSEGGSYASVIPTHTVRFCLAVRNKNRGFYSNHHLGGITWYNNSAYQNPENFNMVNRKSVAEVVDVPGYGHILKNNVSYKPRTASQPPIVNMNEALCTVGYNSFTLNLPLTDSDFVSLDESLLTAPRKPDGSLPDIVFMKPQIGSRLVDAGVNIGYSFYGDAPDLGYLEQESRVKVLQSIIQQEFNIDTLPYQTPKTEAAFGLPNQVVLRTDEGDLFASIAWNLDACDYNPAQITLQRFAVGGTIILPVGVINLNNIPLQVLANVVVQKTDSKVLLSIVQPSDIPTLPNGTPKRESALGLPVQVMLETDEGNLPASVEWNVVVCAYNPNLTAAQSFFVNGTVILPEGIINPNDITLEVAISVAVAAAGGSISGMDDNTWESVGLYPVPFTDKLHVAGMANGTLNLLNSSGVLIYEQKIVSSNEIFHWESLPAGVYFVLLEKFGKVKAVKVVKK